MTILYGVLLGLGSGVLVGVLTMVSDGIFYTKFAPKVNIARKYSSMFLQLAVFMLISIVYGGIQGAVFAWLMPMLPGDTIFRGLVFGILSYVMLSRHFVEGFAFMSPEVMPPRVSIYLAVEFLLIYLIQGILISRGMIMLG